MVALLSKTEIQSLNIDTVEKALVFGGLVLRAALVGSDNANADDINVGINVSAVSDTEGNLNLEIYIPYSAYQLNAKGGKLIEAVGEYQSNSPNLLLDLSLESVSTSSDLTIPDYDERYVTSIEKYLVYYAQILWSSVANKRSGPIALTFLGNQEEPQLLISVNLPLNLDSWLNGSNYLDAVSPVVTSYVDPNPLAGAGNDPNSVGYYYSFNSPSAYSFKSTHNVVNPGLLEKIIISANFPTETGINNTLILIAGNEPDIDTINIYDNKVYELELSNFGSPVFLNPGDIIGFVLTESPAPTYFDINIYILEAPGQS